MYSAATAMRRTQCRTNSAFTGRRTTVEPFSTLVMTRSEVSTDRMGPRAALLGDVGRQCDLSHRSDVGRCRGECNEIAWSRATMRWSGPADGDANLSESIR